jgi:4-diphosphocytidyl-2-C-methyl-D-erythritol kinase
MIFPMFSALAPAKLNLFLHVCGKRADGYHNLESLIFFADCGDRITLQIQQEEKQDSLSVSGRFAAALPDAADNLVIKAITRLRHDFPMLPFFAIQLEKNLPVAAGIGGGSSDAAAVLRILTTHFLGQEAPLALLLELGAEMPICYANQTAFIHGIGDGITPCASLPAEWGVLLVNPCIPLPTAAVFAALQHSEMLPSHAFSPPHSADEWLHLCQQTQNNLTPAALRIVPEIAVVLDGIRKQEGCFLSRMSGSGATCFGLFHHPEAAVIAAHRIAVQHPNWWVMVG